MGSEGSEPTIGVITALPKEFAAARAMLDDVVDTSRGERSRRRYVTGRIPGSDGGAHFIALALLPTMGNNSATQRATLLLEHFPTVHHVIMVGIAGGAPNAERPDEHVRLGDIVVSGPHGIVQYDYVTETISDITHRNPPRPPSAALLEAVQILTAGELSGQRPWLRHFSRAAAIRGSERPARELDVLRVLPDEAVIPHPVDDARRPNEPRVFVGTIGSANILLRNAAHRDRMRDKFKIRAFEMEGSGIADATWALECGYLAIRGICDYCDAAKDDRWQNYAAVAAAAYMRALIECLPTIRTTDTGLDATQHDTTKFVEQAESLYRMMHYQVERDREFGDRRVPLLLTGSLGDVTLHRVVACLPWGGTIVDLDGFVATLRQVKREIPTATGTLVLGASLPPNVARYAASEGIGLTTLEQLDAQLFDGRAYVIQLRNALEADPRYRPNVYIEPQVTVGDDADRDPARDLLDEWLSDPEWNQLTLLGDVGTGKTFLTHMLALRLAKAHLEAPLKYPLPLLVDLRNADRAFSLEGLLATHFQQRGLSRMTFALFEHALANGRIILLFDGFDEMATRVTPEVTTRNFNELVKRIRGRAKVLLTCRTHYFLDRQTEHEVLLGSGRGYESEAANRLYWDLISRRGFRVAYLCPFETEQVEQYVRQMRPHDFSVALKKLRDIYDLMELSRRPMLLEMIVSSLDRLQGDSINAATLYRVFTDVWIQRDRWRDSPLSPDSKHRLVTSLACRLWTSGTEQMHHRELANHFAEVMGSGADARTILEVDSEMRTASFLVRNPEGEYRFAHKSYAEFFVANHLAVRMDAGDVMCLQVPQRITPEHLAFVVDLIKARDVVETLLERVLTGSYTPNMSENAVLSLAAIRRAASQERSSSDGLVAMPDGMRLDAAQLSGVRLVNLRMRRAVLARASLCETDLRSCDLSSADLGGADCRNATMSGVCLDFAICTEANFSGADLNGASLIETQMTGAVLTDAILTGTLLAAKKGIANDGIGLPVGPEDATGDDLWTLRRFIARTAIRLAGPADADDLTQEALLRIYQLPKDKWRTADQLTRRSVAEAIVFRTFSDIYLRRKSKGQWSRTIALESEALISDSNPEADLLNRELTERFDDALRDLSPDAHSVLLMRSNGESFDEIARLLGISDKAARVIYVRAIDTVRRKLRLTE